MKFLLGLFVKNYENTEDPKVRGAVGKLSGIVGMVCNAILCAGKLFAGILSGSVSITADAVNNLSDMASSLVTLVGFRLAEMPADENHPYGHARFEYLSGLAVAAMILVIGVELAKTSLGKILNPEAVAVSLPMALILVGSIAVKLWMAAFNKYLGTYIDSAALMATAADSRNDVISTAAVLVAALLETFTNLQVDGYMGLAVAAFILYSGIDLGKQTISPLLGETASPELRRQIVNVVEEEPLVIGYHDLMVHDYGPGQRFGSIHVEMDRSEDPILCHEIIDDMERLCLEKHNVHLVIHYDPVITGNAELDELKQVVQNALTAMDERLSLHDFRMVKGTGHTNIVFDVGLPQDLSKRQKEIRSLVDQALADLDRGTFYTVITFDPEAFNNI